MCESFWRSPHSICLKLIGPLFSTLGLTQEMIKALTSRAHFLQILHCHKLVICMHGCELSHFLFPFYFPIYAKLQTSNNSRATPPPLPSNLASPQKNGKGNQVRKWGLFSNVSASLTHTQKIKIKSPPQKKQRAKLPSFLSNNSLFLKPCIIIK